MNTPGSVEKQLTVRSCLEELEEELENCAKSLAELETRLEIVIISKAEISSLPPIEQTQATSPLVMRIMTDRGRLVILRLNIHSIIDRLNL